MLNRTTLLALAGLLTASGCFGESDSESCVGFRCERSMS